MLNEALRLARAGFAIHWLHPKSKRPIGNDWSTASVASPAALEASYAPGNNVGVRLGEWSKIGDSFLHVLDVDIRKPELRSEAMQTLVDLFPSVTLDDLPTVQSGSGGASRHFFILSPEPFPSRKLAMSDGFAMVWDDKLKKDVKKRDWEIEFYGTGKQVALPPSIHPDTGQPYRWITEFDFDLVEMGLGPIISADVLRDLLEYDPESEVEIDQERNKPLGLSVEETRELLSKLPNDDLDYDEWLNVMASVQHEAYGRSKAEREQFYEVFRAWSAQSDKHDARTAKYKFFSFKNSESRSQRTMRSIKSQVRENEIMAAFDDSDEDDLLSETGDVGETDIELDLLGDPMPKEVSKRQQKLNKADVEHELGHVPPKVKTLNRKHAVALVKGKTVILHFHKDGDVSYGSPTDLHAFYENQRVATEKATEPVTKMWQRHKDRREYPNGIVFSPNRDVPGAYNHWQGFAVEPNPNRSCRRFLKHLFKVICRENEENYRYLLGWLAHLIQRPEEKPGVAIVFRGKKGTGKDTVGDYVGGLFPHHHVKIANQEQLTGKFNQHQEKCLLLHVEEGFWAGSKNAEGPLKHLITSEDVLIEPKGINPFKVRSVLRLMITSNERWVVPATADERRYFVLDVGDSHMQDTAYFAKMREEMNDGGREALLDYLMNYDLSDFNVRAVPDTEALAEQKVEGLKNIEKWWFSQLEDGEVDLGGHGGFGDDSDASKWDWSAIEIDRKEFRHSYSRWMRAKRYDGEELTDAEFGKRLHAMLPSVTETRPHAAGKRVRCYRLPALEQCRKEFEKFLGSEIFWPEIEGSVAEPVEDEIDDLLS